MVKQKPRPMKNDRIGAQNEQQDDIAQYFKTLQPPPPPDNDKSWELQYCRWWGWNWVKKKEKPRYCPQEQEVYKKDRMQQSRAETKYIARPEYKHRHEECCNDQKVRKKHFKQLCNCLCFKKTKSMDPSLQELYKTPSNSVVLHETYTCGYTERHGDSISCLEMRRNVSRTGKRGACKCNFHRIVSQDNKFEEEISSSFQDEDDDTPEQYRSTEESSEYINVNCCCTGGKNAESPPKKTDFQTQTSCKPVDKNVDTNLLCSCKVLQKAARSKKKTKNLHIICHCCCCKCNNLHGVDAADKTNNDNQPKTYLEESAECQCPTTRRCTENYRVEKIDMPYGIKEKLLIENVNFLETMRPWDRIFHGSKAFSKFGTPSKKYSWVHGTQSDILDKCYSLKIDEEFSSPVSGKKYSLAPVKFDNFDDGSTSTLPDPIDVEEDITYLNHLENQIKTDFKSRVMLDNICDAILFKARNNGVRDESAWTPDYHVKDDNILSEYLHRNGNFPSREYSSTPRGMDSILPESNPQTRHQRIVQQVEDMLRNLLSNDDVESDDVNRHHNQKNMKIPSQNRDISDSNLHSRQSGSTKNFNKRISSPFLSEQPKRLKCELTSTDSLVKTVDNLIAKIDEITVKGKVNVEKIQNVFNMDTLHISNGKPNWDRNYAECSEQANPSDIFHKIDQIIKCSNDNNEKIENVMQNTCPKICSSICNGIDDIEHHDTTTPAKEKNEIENVLISSKELVNISLDDGQQNDDISERDETDTNLVNIKKKKCKGSMIPVRGKHL